MYLLKELIVSHYWKCLSWCWVTLNIFGGHSYFDLDWWFPNRGTWEKARRSMYFKRQIPGPTLGVRVEWDYWKNMQQLLKFAWKGENTSKMIFKLLNSPPGVLSWRQGLQSMPAPRASAFVLPGPEELFCHMQEPPPSTFMSVFIEAPLNSETLWPFPCFPHTDPCYGTNSFTHDSLNVEQPHRLTHLNNLSRAGNRPWVGA